uniref:Uncharacterized protein n=1 Tax=Mantoniella antarctica TaxID=81844 RepID=A0A7S0T2W0_9CHLO
MATLGALATVASAGNLASSSRIATPRIVDGSASASKKNSLARRGGGGRSGFRGGAGGARAVATTEARLSGFSGPRVSGTARPSVSLVGTVLDAASVGDLLALVLTPGDGEGHFASGEDNLEEMWCVVTKISTSSGGRHMVEGEMFGLKVQIVDQPQGGARLGVTGVVMNRNDRWLEKYPGWESHLVRQAQIEPLLKSSVVGAKIVSSLRALEACVAAHPGAWTSGEVSASRRAVITDPLERATQCAGELLALLAGERSVVMCQLWAGWVDPGEQPAGAPWVTQLLRRAAENEDIGIEMSMSDDVEGHPGLTTVLYNKKAVKATKPAHVGNAGEINALAATTIATLGSQANCPAVTPYERVLVGMALGYGERDIAYHLDKLGSPFSAAVFMRARQVLNTQ